MKILKIRFRNINSLKDTHEIDFSEDPLSTSGLFAITGVTGSGKTTILDVITLALYNRIPRIKTISSNVIKKNGVILTRNMTEGFAEVVYECTSGIYRSKWSISKTRTGTFRDYEMELANDATDTLLDGVGRTQVPAKNEALIGLSYDQFVRAILLAQGDFATFLKSNENERGKLLEQITGGEIYRKLGMKAYEMNSIHGAELKSHKERKQDYEERLLNEEDYKILIGQLKKADTEILDLNKKKEELVSAVKLKKDIGEAGRKIQSLSLAREEIKLKKDAFNQNQGKQLEKHRALVPVQEKLVFWNQDKEKEAATGAKLERTRTAIRDVKKDMGKLKDQVTMLTGDAQDDPIAAITLLEKKVHKLDQEITVESVKLSEKTRAISLLAHEMQIPFDSAEISEFSLVVNRKLLDNDKRGKQIETSLGKDVLRNPKQSLADHRVSLSVVGEVVREDGLIKQHQLNLAENLEADKRVKTLLAEFPIKIELKSTEVEKLKLQLNLNRSELENRTLRASLEEHRKKLETGKPCPLCGALEHPFFKEEAIEADELLQKAKKLEEAFSNENASLIAMRSQLDGATSQETELLSKGNTIKRQLEEQTAKRNSHLQSLPVSYREQEIDEAKKTLEAQIPMIENYQELSTNQKKLNEISSLLKLAGEIETALNTLSEERTGLYDGTDFNERMNGIRSAWTGGQSQLKNNEGLLKEISDEQLLLKSRIEGSTNEIMPFVKRLGYEELAAVFADLLAAEKAEELAGLKGEIDTHLNENQTESRVVGESLEKMKLKDHKSTLEELKKSETDNLEKLRIIAGERDLLVSKRNQHNTDKLEVDKLNRLIEELGKKNKKWDLLNTYIGDAEGKKFSTFAQTLTLYQLIILANKRLAMLDDRYILSIPREGEDKSLSVIDQHMGDVRRSVKSLSGGETFLISLALALALSDLAARKVELKSLFIDEGFGSLDKLTLDQTIDTLEKLQYESGKNIGVISHVEAMQERITTQIQVSKNGQGHSKLEIV